MAAEGKLYRSTQSINMASSRADFVWKRGGWARKAIMEKSGLKVRTASMHFLSKIEDVVRRSWHALLLVDNDADAIQ